MSHPILAAADLVDEALKTVADSNPTFMSAQEKAEALRRLTALGSRLDELQLRVLAQAGDVAEQGAAADPAAWLAAHTRQRHEQARAHQRLAEALDRRHLHLAMALREGRANLAQTQAIARSLDGLLDQGIDRETCRQAETALIEHAASFGPRELSRIGSRILDVIAPEIAEAAEARRLEALESEGARRTRLTMRRCGDGSTRLSAVLPDATATRLATYLEAFTNPRQPREAASVETDPVARLPYPRALGESFGQLLECVDPARLPVHAGDATTILITLSLEQLRSELATAELFGGETVPGPDARGLSAGQVRRLACSARLIPAVLGGGSEPLDLGRARRLFSSAQRKALLIRDPHCRAEGCDIPGTWSEAHHWAPWAGGGGTDLDNAVLLCHHHHRRVHDGTFRVERMPDGGVRFHRRT